MKTVNLITLLSRSIENLFPGYFSLVMATGIVSISLYLLENGWIVELLFQINRTIFAVLAVLTLLRCVVHPLRVLADLANPAIAPGFLTAVAGTCILGSQFVIFDNDYEAGYRLWLSGFVLWVLLIYALFAAMAIRRPAPGLIAVDGSWLLAVVATQSVSVLGMLLAPSLADDRSVFVLLSLSLYLLGCVLYLLLILLIVYRLVLLPLKARDLVPSYWINMGAAAISTLAGATLMSQASLAPWLSAIIPFLEGFTLLFWTFGTWWIPLLIILGIWRYLYKRFPIHYEPSYWSFVFPLGMYSTCTYQLAKVMDLSFLRHLHPWFCYASLFAWIVLFAGFLYEIGIATVRWAPRKA
jgi:tellurite resistance protein TehA-like permease